nr:hypothetical protein CFP56_02682 [Quercus suber]
MKTPKPPIACVYEQKNGRSWYITLCFLIMDDGISFLRIRNAHIDLIIATLHLVQFRHTGLTPALISHFPVWLETTWSRHQFSSSCRVRGLSPERPYCLIEGPRCDIFFAVAFH